MERKTPLYEKHVELNGKMVPFAGYWLPVQYPAGTLAEHMAVRTAAGLFDVSHMGEFLLKGPDAFSNLQRLLTNQFDGMEDGQVRYSPMCNDMGGVLDDLLVYRFAEESYLLVVNAANREKDRKWISTRLKGEVIFEDLSDRVAQIALQGPASRKILQKVTGEHILPERYYHFIQAEIAAGIKCLISRTGYTGDQGFEVYLSPQDAPLLWDALLEAGREDNLLPCGLGARDTLRLEAAMPLYGHEMDETISPLETGLDFAVKLDKEEDFIGRRALIEKGAPKRRRVGLFLLGRGIAREGAMLYIGERSVGTVTSGTHCPFLGRAAAMALVDAPYSNLGTRMEVDVRGKRIPVEVTALPFYQRKK